MAGAAGVRSIAPGGLAHRRDEGHGAMRYSSLRLTKTGRATP